VIQNIQNIKINNEPIFYIDSDDPVISHLKSGQLFGYHNWLTLNEFILESSSDDAYVIDCGAHIGTFSFIPAAFNDQKMILIDGAKNNTECLLKTFAHKKNVEIHNKILLDSKRRCDFNSDYVPFGSASINESGSDESVTLDEIIGDRKVIAIKFDIEGNEPEALLGSKQTIEINKPPMLIEVNGHCLRLQNKLPKGLFDVLDSINYKYFIKNNQQLISIDKNEIFPFCVIDIICIHKDNIKYYNHVYDIAEPISTKQLLEIAKQNFSTSNQDCKNYFNTLNLEL